MSELATEIVSWYIQKHDEKLYFTDRERFRSLVSGGESEQMA